MVFDFVVAFLYILSVRAKRCLISCTDLGREVERSNFNAGAGAQFTAPQRGAGRTDCALRRDGAKRHWQTGAFILRVGHRCVHAFPPALCLLTSSSRRILVVLANVEANRHFAVGWVWAKLLKPKPGPPQSVRLSDLLGHTALVLNKIGKA